MRISDWSSYVCSSDLDVLLDRARMNVHRLRHRGLGRKGLALRRPPFARQIHDDVEIERRQHALALIFDDDARQCSPRSEERTVGKAFVSTLSSRWSPYHSKKNTHKNIKQPMQLYI